MAVGAPREAPASTAPLERVKKLQLQIASSTDLNPLAHLIKEARTLHSKLTQGNADDPKSLVKALTLAARVVSHSLVGLSEKDKINFEHVDEHGLSLIHI